MLDSAASPARLHFTYRDLDPETSVLTVEGEIDLASAPALKSELLALLVRGYERLVLDLSGVTHMDSTGLGVLVGIRRRLPDGGRIAIAGAAPNVRELFAITGLDHAFELFSTVDDAAPSLHGGAAAKAPALSPDAALVLGLASTAIPFADSRAAEAERWLRVLRMHGDASRTLNALGFGESAVAARALGPADAAAEADPRDAVGLVAEWATRIAGERCSSTVGTIDLLAGVMAVYGGSFDRVLRAHGADPDELLERVREGYAPGRD
jgi:anti-sigma B factor antagonist